MTVIDIRLFMKAFEVKPPPAGAPPYSARFGCSKKAVSCVNIAYSGYALVAGFRDGTSVVWYPNPQNAAVTIEGEQPVLAVLFCPIQRTTLFIMRACSVQGWNFEKKKMICEAKLQSHGSISCCSMDISPRGDALHVGYSDGVIRVWDLEDVLKS